MKSIDKGDKAIVVLEKKLRSYGVTKGMLSLLPHVRHVVLLPFF